MKYRRHSPLVTHGRYTPRPREIQRRNARAAFNAWASGKSYEEAAKIAGLKHATDDEIRNVIRWHCRVAEKTYRKWQRAEIKCHALAMELRLLRIGKEAPPDQPIETLNPPKIWLREFLGAGIETVNQLRAVDAEMLLAIWKFPSGAIDWAVLKMDKLGLSHVLRRPEKARYSMRLKPGEKR